MRVTTTDVANLNDKESEYDVLTSLSSCMNKVLRKTGSLVPFDQCYKTPLGVQ